MTAVLTAQRQATQRLIDENPVSIVIRREEFVQAATGGRVAQSTTLPSFQGRIVPTKRQLATRQDEAGRLRLSHWTLIAPWSADIRAETDTFTALGRNFRVTGVIQRRLAGEIYTVHASLEEVS